ncbi:hypothetical protein N4R57_09900 [Rhodobacteraceae bacterium D3-12]|nr:hypothetical protein N4R57_09900 [Rhodobacteraceae bacterium D3-12]
MKSLSCASILVLSLGAVSANAETINGFDPAKSCIEVLSKTGGTTDQFMVSAWVFGYLAAQSGAVRPVTVDNNKVVLENLTKACVKSGGASLLTLVGGEKAGKAPAPQVTPQPAPQAQGEPEPQPHQQAQGDPQPQPQPQPQRQSEGDPQPQPQQQAQGDPQPQPQPQRQSEGDPQPQPQQQAQGDPQPKPQVAPVASANSEAAARALLAQFMDPGADRAALTQALIAKPHEIRAVYGEPLASKMIATYAKHLTPGVSIGPKPGQSEILTWYATTGGLRSGSAALADFPGGYGDVRPYFIGDYPIVRFKFVEPGKTLGMAFDGLIFVGNRWVWMPKPWRALN